MKDFGFVHISEECHTRGWLLLNVGSRGGVYAEVIPVSMVFLADVSRHVCRVLALRRY